MPSRRLQQCAPRTATRGHPGGRAARRSYGRRPEARSAGRARGTSSSRRCARTRTRPPGRVA
eukprot:4512071-Alexandrium_andersonii.AAC.1